MSLIVNKSIPLKISSKAFILIALLMSSFIISACSSSLPSIKPISTQTLSQNFNSLEAILNEYDPQNTMLNSTWFHCIEPLFKQAILKDSNRNTEIQFGKQAIDCAVLLSRPSQEERPQFLDRNWLILDMKEHIRPALALQSQIQNYIGPLKHALNRGDWSIEISLLRLPPYEARKRGERSRHILSTHVVPEPLLAWQEAKVEQAQIIEWQGQDLSSQPLKIPIDITLKELPPPRVGQVLKLKLSRPAPEITRGAWALHHKLWCVAPLLRRQLTLETPKGLKLSTFESSLNFKKKQKKPHSHSNSYGQSQTWIRYLQPTGEGGDLYVSTMSSWEKLHQWLWARFDHAFREYQFFVTQQLNSKALRFFLYPRHDYEIHRWLKNNLNYSAQNTSPYTPLPIKTLFKTKSGDCKELNTLAQVLLKQQGQPSFIALTSSKMIPRHALNTPSIGWFNHVMLWRPSPEALKIAQLSAHSSKVVSLGLSQHEWYDATATMPNTPRQGLAYVLLGPKQGVWLSLDDRHE